MLIFRRSILLRSRILQRDRSPSLSFHIISNIFHRLFSCKHITIRWMSLEWKRKSSWKFFYLIFFLSGAECLIFYILMKPKKKTDCDFVVKAVIIGDSGVGKTNILLRYCDNCFKPAYSSTIGVDFKIKTLQVEELKIKLQIWDTAGQEKFKNLSTTFYKGALIIILTYDEPILNIFNYRLL